MSSTTESAAAPANKPNWLINRNFALLWVGDVISALGDYSFTVTLTIWVALTLANHQVWAPLAITGLLLAATLPMIIVGPIAGVYVDRWDKRRTMMAVDLIQAALVGVLVLTTFAPDGHLPLGWQLGIIYADSFLLVSVDQFFNQAGNTLISDIVAPADQPRAIGRVLTMVSIGTIVGPAIGAPMFVLLGPTWALLINACSFLFSFALLLGIRPPNAAESDKQAAERKKFFPEFAGGLRFLLNSPILRAMLITFVISTIGTTTLTALNVFFVTGRENLNAPPALYGLVGASLGVGTLVGSLIGSKIVGWFGFVQVFWGSLLAEGLLILIYTRLTIFPAALVVLFLLGIPIVAVNIASGSLYYRVTPRDVLARTTAARVSIISVAALIGSTLAGYLASTLLIKLHVNALGTVFGPVDTIILGGGVFALIAGLYALLTVHYTAPPPEPAAVPAAPAEPSAEAIPAAESQPSQELA